MAERLHVAVLLSGGGTTLANLLEYGKRGALQADIGLVVSSNPRAKGLRIAREAGIRAEVVASEKYAVSAREGEVIRDWAAMSRDLDALLLSGGFDLICMAGFLSRYLFSDALIGKIINIHPALIPMFCGEGMYGRRVHEAVIAAGVKVSGCTVHYADQSYDTGPIILQRCCPVYSGDSAADVAARVFVEEKIAYPEAVNLIAEGRIRFVPPHRAYVEGDTSIKRFTHDVD